MRIFALAFAVFLGLSGAPFIRVVGAQDFVDPGLDHSKKPGEPILYVVPDRLQVPNQYRFDQPFQSGKRCGPNAIFCLLRILDLEVDYDQVVANIPTGEHGTNLEDLRSACESYGLFAEVVKLSPDDLKDIKLPALLHINSKTASDTVDSDHFIVIVRRMIDGGYSGADTTNGLLTTWKPEWIGRNFSGYCLLVSRGEYWFQRCNPFLLLSTTIVLALNLVNAIARVRGKRLSGYPGTNSLKQGVGRP